MRRRSGGIGREAALGLGACALGHALWQDGRGKACAQGTPYRSRLPVICVGNFTAGGGGKTPTAIAVAALLEGSSAQSPPSSRAAMAATRKGPVLVERGPQRGSEWAMSRCCWLTHCADHGLPPTARQAPRPSKPPTQASSSWMTASRIPSLAKDLSLIVVDAGVGTRQRAGHAAGPVAGAARRADRPRRCAGRHRLLAATLRRSSIVFTAHGKPVVKARIVPRQDRRWLSVLPVIGFAGIASPQEILCDARDQRRARAGQRIPSAIITATPSARPRRC